MARPTGVVSFAGSIPPPPTNSGAVVIPLDRPEGTPPEPLDSAPFVHVPDTDTGPHPALTGAKAGLTETQLEQGVRNDPAPAPADSGQFDGNSQEELPAPAAEVAETKEVAEIKEVVAEKLGVALSLDEVKKTEYGGNAILDMSAAQRTAYNREVSEVQEKIRGAERAYVLAQWYMGSAALKLQKDAKELGGTTYGQATAEGFAHDIGRDKSTVYKAMKLAKGLTFNRAQALTITVEAFQMIQKAPDKIRDWVMDEIVKRCQNGQKFNNEQVERVVEALTWYPSLTAQADKPVEVQKALDALVSWDPKALPGKDKPVFDVDAAKKAIAGAAPDLLPVVKADEKSAKSAEKAKRDIPGTNSKTGQSHTGVAKAVAKALETVIEKAGSLVISINEAQGDDAMAEKAYDNFAGIVEKIVEDAASAIEVLQGIVEAANVILEEPAPEPVNKKPKKKAKKRGK